MEYLMVDGVRALETELSLPAWRNLSGWIGSAALLISKRAGASLRVKAREKLQSSSSAERKTEGPFFQIAKLGGSTNKMVL